MLSLFKAIRSCMLNPQKYLLWPKYDSTGNPGAVVRQEWAAKKNTCQKR
jgi:hypothetical protein